MDTIHSFSAGYSEISQCILTFCAQTSKKCPESVSVSSFRAHNNVVLVVFLFLMSDHHPSCTFTNVKGGHVNQKNESQKCLWWLVMCFVYSMNKIWYHIIAIQPCNVRTGNNFHSSLLCLKFFMRHILSQY